MRLFRSVHSRPVLIAIVFSLAAYAGSSAAQSGGQASADLAEIEVPAGSYTLDRNHSSLSFNVHHLGLSNYVMRFTQYDVKLDLQPESLDQSSVEVTVDPTSVATDYYANYRETHPDAEYDSWTQTLAQSDKFLNAGQHPQIRYKSTAIEKTGPDTLRISGDLTLRGQTHPVTLNATLTGATANHPMAGVGAVAFAATGTFKRSTFGMNYLLSPPIVGDTTTLNFNGEFLAPKPEDS